MLHPKRFELTAHSTQCVSKRVELSEFSWDLRLVGRAELIKVGVREFAMSLRFMRFNEFLNLRDLHEAPNT